MASSPSASGVMLFLNGSPIKRSSSIMVQKEFINFKDKTANRFIGDTKTKLTTEQAGLKQLRDMQANVDERIFAGKSGTTKGSFNLIREITIGDLVPVTQAGNLQMFNQARVAQEVAAKITPTTITGKTTVRAKPEASNIVTPPIGILSATGQNMPTMNTTQPASGNVIGADMSPFQDWKKVVPILIVLLVALTFGKRI